jgi:cell division protein FtsL
MDNQPTTQQSQQPVASQPQQFTAQTPKRSKLLPVVVGLALLLIVAVGFGVYSWQHKKVADSNTKVSSLQSQITGLQGQVSKLSKQAQSTNQTPAATSPTSSTSYLVITQLNIKIPLTSSISDLSYTWDASTSRAVLGSATLMSAFVKEDPTDCSNDSSTPYPISYISTDPNLDSTNSTPGYIKQVAVKGTAYYWYLPGAGNGCDFNPSTALNSQVTDYYNTTLAQFSSAIAN